MRRAVSLGTVIRAGIGAMIITFVACRDSGLPGMNLPLEEAQAKPPPYVLYDAAGNVAPVRFADRDWRTAGPVERINEQLLVRVTVDAGRDVFALATDPEPHSRLYVRSAQGFVPLAPVD